MEQSPSTSRLTAAEIFHDVADSARDELARSTQALAYSGLAAGLAMGLTGLGVASVLAVLGNGSWEKLVADLFYPLGFVVVIIGRQQLFTENTLYPVVLVLDERRHVRNTLRLWSVVFCANVVGAVLFAVLMIETGAIGDPIKHHLVHLGDEALRGSFAHTFWSGVIGGWLIALVAWLVSAGQWTIAQVVLIWAVAFVVGIGHFDHCIATSAEILSGVVAGNVGVGSYCSWLAAATCGNIAGGVVIVAVLNYAQVHAGEEEKSSG